MMRPIAKPPSRGLAGTVWVSRVRTSTGRTVQHYMSMTGRAESNAMCARRAVSSTLVFGCSVTRQTAALRSQCEQLRAFVEGSKPVGLRAGSGRAAAYELVRQTLVRFECHRLGREDRRCVRAKMGKVYGVLRGTDHAADPEAGRDRRWLGDRAGAEQRAVVRHGLHAGGDPAAGRAWSRPSTARCLGWRLVRSCADSSRSTATRAWSVWRGCRARTSTTCARRAPTGRSGRPGRRPAPARVGHRRAQGAGAERPARASCAWTSEAISAARIRSQGVQSRQRRRRGHPVRAPRPPCRASPSGSWRRSSKQLKLLFPFRTLGCRGATLRSWRPSTAAFAALLDQLHVGEFT